jgi:hypothetical protein
MKKALFIAAIFVAQLAQAKDYVLVVKPTKLSTQSFEKQYKFGLDVLKRHGW